MLVPVLGVHFLLLPHRPAKGSHMEVIVPDFNESENIENTENTKILKIQVAYDILSTVSSSFQVVFRSFIIKHNICTLYLIHFVIFEKLN